MPNILNTDPTRYRIKLGRRWSSGRGFSAQSKAVTVKGQVHLSLNAMRPSGGVIGGAHGLAAETVPVTSEPLKFSGGVRFVCPHKPQLFI